MARSFVIAFHVLLMLCLPLSVGAGGWDTGTVKKEIISYDSIEISAYPTYGQMFEIKMVIKGAYIEKKVSGLVARGIHEESSSGTWLISHLGADGKVDQVYRSSGHVTSQDAGTDSLIVGDRYDLQLTLGTFSSRIDKETVIAKATFYADDDSRQTFEVKFGRHMTRGEFIEKLAELDGVDVTDTESYLAWAVGNVMLKGRFISSYETYYDLNLPITWQDLAYTSRSFAELRSISLCEGPDVKFDETAVDRYALSSVKWSFRTKVSTLQDGDYQPKGYVERDDALHIISMLSQN
jgi:hypothetical protein